MDFILALWQLIMPLLWMEIWIKFQFGNILIGEEKGVKVVLKKASLLQNQHFH